MGFEVALKKYALLRIFLAVTEGFLQPQIKVFVFCVAKRQEEIPSPQSPTTTGQRNPFLSRRRQTPRKLCLPSPYQGAETPQPKRKHQPNGWCFLFKIW